MNCIRYALRAGVLILMVNQSIQAKMILQDVLKDTARQIVKDNTLIARAVLPSNSFAVGPTCGRQLGSSSINGVDLPFVNKQPVQGFSSILKNDDNTFLVMTDNGFGTIENSADWNLRVYTIKPDFKTAKGGKGNIEVFGYIELHDPDKHIPFAITNFFTKERVLTGADLDIESMQRANDGTLWFGDEFGPFLLHTDAKGKLLEPPFVLPDFENPGKEVRTPQNPFNEEASAIRIMNAVQAHARAFGNNKTPVCSPWYEMLKDGNQNTGPSDRINPPAGLAKASGDIFDVSSLRKAGFPVVSWTINDLASMEAATQLGVTGIISDRPDLLRKFVETYDGNKDGKPDFLDEDGLVNINLFDAQGHRGARSLRPENTLPAMEAALDNLMTTLETDVGITSDNLPVLNHDPHIESAKVRRSDDKAYAFESEVLIKNLTLREIQTNYIADKLLVTRKEQTNNRTLSPVSLAFAKRFNLKDVYIMPSLQQLFEFVKFYSEYYKTGEGSQHPESKKRWKNADRVHFNIETKINPRTDKDARDVVFAERTVGPDKFAHSVAKLITEYGLSERADIQSFDFRTLLIVHQHYPQIRTVCLFGDFPKIGNENDGDNLQDQNGANTPWLAGLPWPYRSTVLNNPFRAKQSGGFEGMGYDSKNNKLLPILEDPLTGNDPRILLIHEFDLESKSFTGIRHHYPFGRRGTAIGDFIMINSTKGLVSERDGSQGNLNGYKVIYEIELKGDGKPVEKKALIDLLNIQDPHEISLPGSEGDVGLGKKFAFPFQTIEGIVIIDSKHIGVVNDNNLPSSIGRHVGQKLPDDNEFIIIKLKDALDVRH